MTFFSDLFKPKTAIVDGKVITSCKDCKLSMHYDNPLSTNYPIYKCMDKGNKTIYNSDSVPSWCPYVK
jgi:hypothetical protein